MTMRGPYGRSSSRACGAVGGWPVPARRIAAAITLLALAAGAPGTARALAPGAAVPTGGPDAGAQCLRATGAPGGTLLQAPAGRDFATDVRAAGALRGTVRLGAQTACADGAEGGGRLLVVAPVAVRRGRGQALRAAFGPGAPVRTLAQAGPRTSFDEVHVAVGPGGQAAVAWVEVTRTGGLLDSDRATRVVRVARASAGAPLGPAELVAPPNRVVDEQAEEQLALGLDAAGTLSLVTAEPRAPIGARGSRIEGLHRLLVRTAPDGAPSRAPCCSTRAARVRWTRSSGSPRTAPPSLPRLRARTGSTPGPARRPAPRCGPYSPSTPTSRSPCRPA